MPPPRHPFLLSHRTWAFWLIALLFLAHALLLSAVQGWRMVDDAYISFRYLDQLLAGEGLVFNPGERVEGYTNFLWIMTLAIPGALGVPIPLAALLLGLLSGVWTLWTTLKLAERLTGASWLGLCVIGLLALDGSFARWAIEGLETLLFTALVTCAILTELDTSSQRRGTGWRSTPGLLLGLATLTRPEGLLWLGLLVLCRLYNAVGKSLEWSDRLGPTGQTYEARSRSLGDPMFWQALASLLLSAGMLIIPHLLWRFWYYGEWIPNTAYLKVQPGFVSALRGVRYAVMFFAHRWPLLLLLLGLWLWRRWQLRQPLPSVLPSPELAHSPLRLLLVFAWGVSAYLLLTGGDWMGWGRFFMPLAPLLSLLWAEKCIRLHHAPSAGLGYVRRLPTIGLLLLATVGAHITSSWWEERPRLARAHAEHQERQAVIAWLKAHASPSARVLTEEIGEIPYETGLYTLDVYGLIDKHIAKTGEYDPDSAPGHQKTDLNYSLRQRPDYLVMADFHHVWARNVDPSAREVRYPLLKAYTPVPVRLPSGRLEIYRLVGTEKTHSTGKD